MKNLLFIGFLFASFLTFGQTLNWVEVYDQADVIASFDKVYDSQGNIYSITKKKIQKFSPTGQFLWSHEYPPMDNYNGTLLGGYFLEGIEIDANDNLYLFGSFNFKIDVGMFGVSTVLTQRTLGGQRDPATRDAFVAKYNSNGQIIWAATHGGTYNGTTHEMDEVLDLHVDINGKVIMYMKGASGDFDPGPGTVSGSGEDFIWVLNANGTFNKVTDFISMVQFKIKSDSQGNIYLSGITSNILYTDFDLGPGTTLITPTFIASISNDAFFTAKYDANFNLLWLRGESGGDFKDNKLLVTSNDEIYSLTKYYTGPDYAYMDLDPSLEVRELEGSNIAGYVLVKYNTDGDVLFVTQINNDNPGPFPVNLNGLSYLNDKIYLNGYIQNYDSGTWSSHGLFINQQQVHELPAGNSVDQTLWDEECFILKISNEGDFVDYSKFSTRKKYTATQNLFDFDVPNHMLIKQSENKIILSDGFNHTMDVDPSALVNVLVPSDTMNFVGQFGTGNSLDVYFVEFSECNSASKPTLSTTSDTICSGTNLTLAVASGNLNSSANWTWYEDSYANAPIGNGNTLQITPNSSHTYLVRGEGACYYKGTPSDSLKIVVYTTPSITFTDSSQTSCGTGSVNLLASASAGTLNWYDAATGGNLIGTGNNITTPVISSSTVYYVESTVGICTSARTPITATINHLPTLISSTNDTVCNIGSAALQAQSDFGTISWYEQISGGSALATGSNYATLGIISSTTYYVELKSGACVSARFPVEAIVTPRPTILSSQGASICFSGSLTLSANASNGTISWYDASVGGNLVGSGTNFITPTISTTTNYFVETSVSSCNSTRTQVTAFVGGPVSASANLSPNNNATAVDVNVSYSWNNVNSAQSYIVEVSENANFIPLTESQTVSATTYNSSINLLSNTQYFWRVKANGACDSVYSATTSFTTSSTLCVNNSTNVPVTIPLTATTVLSTINVTDDLVINNLTITDLQGVHSYISDLKITLISPAGTQVVLMNALCNSQDNFNIKFSDAASSNYAQIPCPPTDGLNYKPLELLSTFNNESSLGIWTLKIEDLYAEDGGSLNSWALNICGTECIPPSVSLSTFNDICNTAAPFTISGGIPSGGIYSGNGISGGTFTPGNASIGQNTIVYSITDGNGCTNSATQIINVQNCAEIKTIDLEEIKIYPNPSNSIVTIEYTEKIETLIMEDALGKVVSNEKFSAQNKIHLNLTNYPKGVYFVKINSNEKVYRIVKN